MPFNLAPRLQRMKINNRICKNGIPLSRKLKLLSKQSDTAKKLRKEFGYYGVQKSMYELNKEYIKEERCDELNGLA